MPKIPVLRKKSWHESKHLRKRAAFLLEDPDLIPADVCFRIRTEIGKIKEVYGHKIFFGLASPVFHAIFYGKMKEKGDVEIVDISVEAFQCMKKYIYTDSYDAISLANVVEVLAASKKYLLAKLTRYCYGFIQNNMTAENSVSLWFLAQHVLDDIVTDQCVAEIRRNMTAVVSTKGFLNLAQDQILELTSWQKLTINEYDLFQAVKKWKTYQEATKGSAISCGRTKGGIFQNIRFPLLGPEQLTDKFILEEVFSAEDLREMLRHKVAGKLTTFSPTIRDPLPSSFRLSIMYFVYDVEEGKTEYDLATDWKMLGSVEVLIWADMAPKACQMLRHYVENEYRLELVHTIGRSTVATGGVLSCGVHRKGLIFLPLVKTPSAKECEVEKRSGLWAVPGSVLLSVDARGLHLNIVNKMWPCIGQQPNIKMTESTAGECPPGTVVGKVLSSSSEFLKKLPGLLESKAEKFRFFQCSIVKTAT